MVILAVAQVFWSTGVEAAVSEGAVPRYLGKCTDELMGLTDLVRLRSDESGWAAPFRVVVMHQIFQTGGM